MSNNLLVGSLYPPNEHTGVAFHGSNSQTVLLITSDGRLEKGPGYSTEEAAQVLFDAVSDHIAGVWKQTRDENAALRADNQAAHALVIDLRAKEHSERTLAVKLERENAALRELVSTLGAPSHVNVPWEKWKQMREENTELRAKVTEQGLSLACLADGILGEDAADRSDQTLVRVGCQLAGEVAALRAALAESEEFARKQGGETVAKYRDAMKDTERLNWMQTITGSEWTYRQLANNLGLTRYDIDVARKKEAQP